MIPTSYRHQSAHLNLYGSILMVFLLFMSPTQGYLLGRSPSKVSSSYSSLCDQKILNDINTKISQYTIYQTGNNFKPQRERIWQLKMMDRSSVSPYISIGATVKVIADINHSIPSNTPRQYSSMGMIGVVSNVWDKCEVDPHCCCAELAYDAPIEVEFILSNYPQLQRLINNSNITNKMTWRSYYGIDEIKIISP